MALKQAGNRRKQSQLHVVKKELNNQNQYIVHKYNPVSDNLIYMYNNVC